ncbi:MAG TPA: hypothetical protein VFQ41_06400 [Candidatus Angelobacter sp.]|nr:hypothetical protein [Candidatus Angelobacter sp.]
MFSTSAGQSCVGGGFIWMIDQIPDYAADQKLKPDPNPAETWE